MGCLDRRLSERVVPTDSENTPVALTVPILATPEVPDLGVYDALLMEAIQ